jgi:hypothetical protein
MTFFQDLTPYTYCRPKEDPPGTVNIGWLERKRPFATDETSPEFHARLEQLCRKPVKQTRGLYPCPFCRGPNKPFSSAEIRVQRGERVYAAPVLVHHYVVAHGYRPPEEFIEAVLAWEEDGGGGG